MVDLHLHTNHSDSSCSVSELLQKAQEHRLSLISITDHNTVSAYEELKKDSVRSLFHGDILTGVEFNTCYNGEAIEILGYGIDLDIIKGFTSEKFSSFRKKQFLEYELIKKTYLEAGIKFDENVTDYEAYELKKHARQIFFEQVPKHPENLPLYYNKESLEKSGVFTRYEVYNPLSRLYVDESPLFPSIDEVVGIIHKAGGKAFLAHLYEYSPNIENNLKDIMGNYALDGMECFHNSFSQSNSEFAVRFCKENGLYMSAGSDYHGTVKPHVPFGCAKTEYDIVKEWTEDYEKL